MRKNNYLNLTFKIRLFIILLTCLRWSVSSSLRYICVMSSVVCPSPALIVEIGTPLSRARVDIQITGYFFQSTIDTGQGRPILLVCGNLFFTCILRIYNGEHIGFFIIGIPVHSVPVEQFLYLRSNPDVNQLLIISSQICFCCKKAISTKDIPCV